MNIYAGIGSRKTPSDVLKGISHLADRLEVDGWLLRSGGADGADQAFAKNPPRDTCIQVLPWSGYNGFITSRRNVLMPLSSAIDARDLIEYLHPAPGKLSKGAWALHARNVGIIMGTSLKRWVRAVICWTPNGEVTGGTGMGIRIAEDRNIPVLNLGSLSIEQAYNKMMELKENE